MKSRPPTIDEKVLKIKTTVIAHAGYAVFQMAEVAEPRDLLLGILDMVDGLQPRAPTTC